MGASPIKIVIVGGVAGGASAAAKARRTKFHGALGTHLQELDPAQETIVYCRVGLRGYIAARILLQHGFTNMYNLTGGYLSYPRTDKC